MPSIERVIEHVITLLGGGLAVFLLTAWRDARRARVQEPAELARAFAELGETLSGGAGQIMEEFRREFRFLRGRCLELQLEVDQVRAENARLERELAASRAGHDDCRRQVESLRAELSERLGELPLGPPAAPPRYR